MQTVASKRLSMPSPKLERVKSQHREVSDLLQGVFEYVRHQIAEHQEFVIPKLAAAALGINEGEAFVLLEMLASGGLLKRQYNVYCRDKDILLQSVDSLEGLDNINHCDFCDVSHRPSDLYVEIAFRPIERQGS